MANIDHIAKNFEASAVEARLYKAWQDAGLFSAQVNPEKKPYTIMMPPPNITGQLHMGHALDNGLQDLLIRFRRMQGYETLWQPGTDHAAIATEAKIVAAMKQEGLTKEDLGRDGFLERAWKWRETYGGRIVEQLKRLGCSCDWARERFTMDEGLSDAVLEVFVKLYEKGLIYRGKKMVNWCSTCLTSISDAEVDYEEEASFLWHIRYPLSDGSGELVVATTRPETLLGDTAVAVNPADERYQSLVGKTLELPLMNRSIPIIADDYVELGFGTACVKITPAHDPNDYEIGLRHQLDIIEVMSDDGHINEAGHPYTGLTVMEARKKVVQDLKEQGYLVKEEPYKHKVGSCYRCSTTIEPKLSLQWFVAMEALAKPAIEAVREGKIRFVPERFEKIYYNWMDNIKDWCISRQLWWGHRIPAWTCDDCQELTVSKQTPSACAHCHSPAIHQDEDTLDTWFSSALWPFSTLGWPNEKKDLEYFYPTQVLVTGPDIIFFWVARMIFSSLEQIGEIPFETVYFHGIVRDALGRKMSKSLDNGIDPLREIDQYGADALRYALVDGNAPGSDQRYRDEKVKAGSAFINKVWNAFRFVMQNLDEGFVYQPERIQAERIEDRWILSRYHRLIAEVTQNLERFEFGVALAKINHFIWEEYCDWYIEMVKPRLRDASLSGHETAEQILLYVMEGFLKLLHPFMPFFTEEIYQHLPQHEGYLMVSPWPIEDRAFVDERAEEDMQTLMDLIRQIRNLRLELNVPVSKRAKLYLLTESKRIHEVFATAGEYMERLAGMDELIFCQDKTKLPEKTVSCHLVDAIAHLPLADLIDLEQERKRLSKELAQAQQQVQALRGKLSNQDFVQKAPEQVVEAERRKLEAQEQLVQQLEERLKEV